MLVGFVIVADAFAVASLAIVRPRIWFAPFIGFGVVLRRDGRFEFWSIRHRQDDDGASIGWEAFAFPLQFRRLQGKSTHVCGSRVGWRVTAELDRAVKTVVRQCMGISPGEEVLVVCNPVTEEIGALMRIEAQGDGADATLAVISERDSAAAEPPHAVAAAMAAADVVLAPTIQSLSHTARPQSRERGGRADRHPAGRHRGDAGRG